MNFELRLGGQGDRPMSVDILRDSANTRSQQHGSFKGEGYTMKASTRSQRHRHLKGEGDILKK
ncbi:hypothetical protein [Candidatus Regiella endosymbiont of Tuberolachnus salignus]|uniref:hypothetical protein n=1 Tax=Candidatus Regiella endosymbiont of Tuberolachnus salignus TaxID=3077956 RepID=UPI0030CF392E